MSERDVADREIWRQYHESTKHTVERLRRAATALDWANMPDPFRHYEGVPVLDLPADPRAPMGRTLDILEGSTGESSVTNGEEFLSQLLFYSAAISATKLVAATGYRYALRVNPSSGNLHPTEFHFLTRGLSNWPDGLYHYRLSSHMAEQRAAGTLEDKWLTGSAPVTFVLTTIAWREAWKYGERAYRYCLHDIGHAWQALSLAARAIGCDSFATGHFPDGEVARSLGLSADEWPMLIVTISGAGVPRGEPDRHEVIRYGGEANRLSTRTIVYPAMETMHAATISSGSEDIEAPGQHPAAGGTRRMANASGDRFGDTVRRRRSALDFIGGDQSMPLGELTALLNAAGQPFSADFANTQFIRLYLYVHRVDELEPGLYGLHWDGHRLEKMKAGDQRVMAAGLSLSQQLAGNACVAFSMVGDLERAAELHGDRGYRYVHFEAGAIGHRLYLAAESLGLAATGIGAFYDDEVSRYLDLETGGGQVVYHFAVGYRVPDPRISPESDRV